MRSSKLRKPDEHPVRGAVFSSILLAFYRIALIPAATIPKHPLPSYTNIAVVPRQQPDHGYLIWMSTVVDELLHAYVIGQNKRQARCA